MKTIDGASAFIFFGEKILLFLRDNKPGILYPNCWAFPGGGIEEGESPQAAIARELVEEVSYCPKGLIPFGKTLNSRNTVYVFIAKVDKDEAGFFKLGKGEGQKIGFYTLSQIGKMKLTPGLEYYFCKYKKGLSEAMKSDKLPIPSVFGLLPF